MGVVDALEEIEVEQQQRRLRLPAPHPAELSPDHLGEVTAVPQAGERITGRELEQALLHGLARRDVLMDADHAQGLALLAAVEHTPGAEDPHPVSILVLQAVLGTVGIGHAAQMGLECRADVTPVVRMHPLLPARHVRRQLVRRIAQNPRPHRAETRTSARHVPVPQPQPGALERQHHAAFALGDLLADTTALGKVAADADLAQAGTVLITIRRAQGIEQSQGAIAAFQPFLVVLGRTHHDRVGAAALEVGMVRKHLRVAQAQDACLAQTVGIGESLVATQVTPPRILEGDQVRHRIDQPAQQGPLPGQRLLRLAHPGDEDRAVDHPERRHLVQMTEDVEEIAELAIEREIELRQRKHPGGRGQPARGRLAFAHAAAREQERREQVERDQPVLGHQLERRETDARLESSGQAARVKKHHPRQTQHQRDRREGQAPGRGRGPATFGQHGMDDQADRGDEPGCEPEVDRLVGVARGDENRHAREG